MLLSYQVRRLSTKRASALRTSLASKLTIETSELEALMQETEVSVLNATIPRRDYVPREDHLKERIKDSTFLDFKGITDGSTGLYYTMPGPELFASKMREMNVGKRDLVVVYDKYRNISAPRVHFMLSQVFGMANVWLLNGTFDKWKAEGRALEQGDGPQAFRKPGVKSEDDFKFEYNKSNDLVT